MVNENEFAQEVHLMCGVELPSLSAMSDSGTTVRVPQAPSAS